MEAWAKPPAAASTWLLREAEVVVAKELPREALLAELTVME
jgi:hypothetical protein